MPGDTSALRTDPLRTVLDRATLLPFREALAVADGALAARLVRRRDLAAAASARSGPGAVACRRAALEADSDTHHGSRAGLTRDCERYDELVAAGCQVLRFGDEQVMFRQAWVADILRRTCA